MPFSKALERVETEYLPLVLAVQGGVVHGNLSVRPVGHPREFRVVGQLVIVFGTAELLPVVGYRFMAPRTVFRPPQFG